MLIVLSSTFSASLLLLAVVDGSTMVSACRSLAWFWMTSFTESSISESNIAAPIPSRAYRPVLVLLSDGVPTDDWEQALERLRGSERAQKATRFAMAIGTDADRAMLAQFANVPEAPVFEGHEARDILRFFRAVTMSVVARSASPTPDEPAALQLSDIPDDDLDLGDL